MKPFHETLKPSFPPNLMILDVSTVIFFVAALFRKLPLSSSTACCRKVVWYATFFNLESRPQLFVRLFTTISFQTEGNPSLA
jgi:hypothetical protein